MDRITRKELKTDKFVTEVSETVEFFAAHRREILRYGAIALAVLVILAAGNWYRRHRHAQRQEALNQALAIYNAPVGQTGNPFLPGYPSEEEKNKAALKAFTELATRHPRSPEGLIATYYLGTMAADRGDLAEAERRLKQVAEARQAHYASLAKIALSDIYRGQGRLAEAEKLLRSLVEKPTDFVSREHATILLAQLIKDNRPEEARKLLEPLRTERSVVSRHSLTVLGEIPPK
ncbi:MAG: tetratricopeptide repeat protein [Bryobacterales bacterium]|nr:tetratricopeptide repeat protein [Bryobacteraceae bacterium]MDW8129614.1 tetratricopeptide repeat protein [Bryobacterales bacterium]